MARELPRHRLDPKIKSVWRISDAIGITLVYLCCVVAWPIVAIAEPSSAWWAWIVTAAVTAAWLVALFVWIVVVSPIRYMRWRYELTPEFLDIARGIIWRKRFIVPFIRVQNTDTKQGPVLRAFGLSSVTVATAAGEHEIPGLDAETAEELRDRAAEFARLAREDV